MGTLANVQTLHIVARIEEDTPYLPRLFGWFRRPIATVFTDVVHIASFTVTIARGRQID